MAMVTSFIKSDAVYTNAMPFTQMRCLITNLERSVYSVIRRWFCVVLFETHIIVYKKKSIEMDVYQPVHVLHEDSRPKINSETETEIKLYRRRWIMLALFIFCCGINIMQYIQYCIIADTIVKYYGVSYIAVDWTGLVILLLYIPFFLPSMCFFNKMGLRATILVGIVGTCAGAWIKVASVSPNRFWVLILGQAFVGVSEIFLIGLASQLAAVWFGSNEVSSACTIGITGVQIGLALGFFVPPLFVDDARTHDSMGEGLYRMAIVIAALNSVLTLVVVALFQEKPPSPPSFAQCKVLHNSKINLIKSLKLLFLNRDFVLLLIAYGIHSGVLLTISMLLNQIVLETHPGAALDAGRLGLCKIFAGIVSSVLWGIILDKYKQFRKTFISGYIGSLVGLAIFALTVDKQLSIVYPGIIVAGFLLEIVYSIAYEVGAELTYPVPEAISGGIITATANIFAIIFTYLYSFLVVILGSRFTNLVIFGALVLGLILVVCIRFELRRQKLLFKTTAG